MGWRGLTGVVFLRLGWVYKAVGSGVGRYQMQRLLNAILSARKASSARRLVW